MGFSPPCLSQSLCFILFLFHFHSTISSPLSSNYSSSSSHLCAHRQSLSLLQFKQSFSIQNSSAFLEYFCPYPFPKTESWKEGTDCLWDGVSCDLKTGHVTALDLSCSMLYGTLLPNNSLFSLHHLQQLDLSFNDFNSSHISSRFGQFSNLTHLNLSGSDLAGQVPSEISHLSKMVSLDLSWNYDLVSVEPISFDKLSFDKLVRNLTKLRELDLSSVNMSLVVPDSLMNLSSSLSSLKLNYCRLKGKLPSSMGKFKHLQYLDLGGNDFTGSIPYDFEQLTELVSLGLSSNNDLSLEPISFHKIVQNLTKLRELDLGYGKFPGRCQHPKTESWKEGTDCCLWDGVSCDMKTGHVTALDLSCSMLYGTLHSNSTLFSLHHLQKLDLSDKDFNNSHISPRFGQFSNLTLLNLNSSVFAGQVPSEISHLSKFVSLDLSGNYDPSLEPISFAKLVRNLTGLRELDLSRGKFPGNIFLLPKLESLDMSYNNRLTGSFPSSNLSNVLSSLDLSNTRISI
ncbi:receptor-like protein Cf-9 [Populus trichocarpa]|uniref:receptor-like protein Cf-9 n=1 Tax=Populus trichocarpa TaxID=3694 RepID=UPI00227905EE|nr:receptor-like protein Cf-9 [Populus trichocarpa]